MNPVRKVHDGSIKIATIAKKQSRHSLVIIRYLRVHFKHG